jgi:hypothetical protein
MKPRYIFLPPGIDPWPGFEQSAGPMGIHPLRSDSCVGRFYKRVVRRVAGMREVDLDPVLIRPGSKIAFLMPEYLQVRLGSQAFAVSGSFARCGLA